MKNKFFLITFLIALISLFAVSCSKKESARSVNDNIDYYTCTMHPFVHSKTPGKCPICGMDLVPVYKKSATGLQPVMNASRQSEKSQPAEFTVPIERQQEIGVTFATVEKKRVIHSIRAVGTVSNDAQRHWDYVSRVEGYVEKLFVASPGVTVERNAPLLTIYSPDLLTTENEFIGLLQARAGETNNPAMLENTGQLIKSAKERLRLWNISDSQIAKLEKTRRPMEDITLAAPFRGVVQSLDATQGEKVMPGEKLASVSDLSVVWVWAQFYQDETAFLRTGLPVTVTITSSPGLKFEGTISLVNPFINEASRTASVRIDVKNPDLKLWPGMYVNAEVNIDEGEQLAVPINAVLPTGRHNIVFVDNGQGKLEPRFIQTGDQFGNFYAVKSGLKEGERVVASGNFLIDAESQVQGALSSW